MEKRTRNKKKKRSKTVIEKAEELANMILTGGLVIEALSFDGADYVEWIKDAKQSKKPL